MKRIVLLLFLITQSLLAQVQFEARAMNSTLGLNQKLRIDFVMNFDGKNFTQPSFEGFIIIGEPFEMESRDFEKNKMKSYEKRYICFLLPKRKGNFRIRKATIEYKGKVYKTSPIKVKVIDSVIKINVKD